MGKGESINLAAIFGGIATEGGRGTVRSRIRGFEMEDSSTSFMKVDVRGKPHCETKRFTIEKHERARARARQQASGRNELASERASWRAVDMSAYYGQAAFIRQKRAFKGGGKIVNSISCKEPRSLPSFHRCSARFFAARFTRDARDGGGVVPVRADIVFFTVSATIPALPLPALPPIAMHLPHT